MATLLQSILVTIIFSCLVTLMAVFLGSDTPILAVALTVQGLLIPLIVVLYLFYTGCALRRVGLGDLLVLYRRFVSGWMWFCFWSINSLVIAGELSFALATWAGGKEQFTWLHHTPLLCAAVCTFAMLAIYMWERIRYPEVVER